MEITKSNFFDELPNITKNLKKSCFVGFDAEFTAILSGECFKHRLFDTSEDRYNNIKTEVSKMIMTQVGLTMFQYDRDHDRYIATGYTFHLCPQVLVDIDQSFIFQASTLNFLCRHNFNFNKFIYEGIPYLSKAEEAKIRQQLKNKTLLQNLLNSLEMEGDRELQHYCSLVSKWLVTSKEETYYLDIDNPVLRYIVHMELRSRFKDILTTDSLGNSNKVLIYRDKYVEGANSAPNAILEENLMSHILGFSQIIALLEQHQKPLIGHNIFLDIILIHNQFIGPLPNDYKKFKSNINKMFPSVFDTKYISHDMGKKLSFHELWKSNALQDLYEFFSERKCPKIQYGACSIKLSTPFNVEQSYHEAGWDSYCSGYCFTYLGHWAACENRGKFRPSGPTEKLAALATYCNRVNVIRGANTYMSVSGSDGPRSRPDVLHVRTLAQRSINISEVAALLSAYGNVDVKPNGAKTALIAAISKHTADKILKSFKDSKEYRICYYSRYKHSVTGRLAIWSGALLTGSLLIFYVNRKIKVLS